MTPTILLEHLENVHMTCAYMCIHNNGGFPDIERLSSLVYHVVAAGVNTNTQSLFPSSQAAAPLASGEFFEIARAFSCL